MHDREATSWRRRSDTAQNAPGVSTSGANEQEAQLEVWEDEGGRTARVKDIARVLIVDNDIGWADSLELMLHAAGYAETRVAYSGHAALAIASGFRPDVVLLDLRLFDMGSDAVAQSLREQARSRPLRLIALTFSPEQATREAARAAGFDRYFTKPFGPDDLSALLGTLSEQAPA
jgi:DNA-binding response OmpR family regulator